MIRTFLRLKLRLLANGIARSRAKAALIAGIIFCLFVLSVVYTGHFALRVVDPAWIEPVVISAFAVLIMVWAVAPLLVGMTDGTIDPSRLVHLPLPRRKLVSGLLASTLIGIVPIAVAIGLVGFLLVSTSIVSALITLVAAFLALLLGSAVAQVGSTSMSGLLQGRRTKDIAGAVLGVMAIGGGIFAQFGLQLLTKVELHQLQSFARIVKWTPGGWLGQAVVFGRDGRTAWALLALLAGLAFVVVACAIWSKLLGRLMTTSESRAAGDANTGTLLSRGVRWFPGLSGPVRAATARSLKSIRRDPRAWANIAGQLPLLLIVGFPVAALANSDQSQAVLFAGSVGLYAGMLNSNLFGYDGRSLWLDLVSSPNMKSVLWGKTLAHALIIGPLLLLIVVGLAAYTGGWRYVIAAIGIAAVAFGSVTSTLATGSVRYGMPMPENVNPFAGSGTGQGMSQGLMLMIALVVGLLIAAIPSAIVIGLSLLRWWLGALVAPLAVVFGILIWQRGINRATALIRDNSPEFLERLTPQ